jgi:hypothetical protein
MAAHAYFYRSVPGASFIVEDESVWLRVEGRAGGYALFDLGPLAENGTINVQALSDWSDRIAELTRSLEEANPPTPRGPQHRHA